MACPRPEGRLADGSNFFPPFVGSGLLLAFLPKRRTLREKGRKGGRSNSSQISVLTHANDFLGLVPRGGALKESPKRRLSLEIPTAEGERQVCRTASGLHHQM